MPERDIPGQQIDWRKELGSELQDRIFHYVLPRDPELVKGYVFRAVFKTLTGQEIANEEEHRFMAGSTNIRDEQTEIAARGLFATVRSMREQNGFNQDRMEAIAQSKIAEEAIKSGREFSQSYDYWAMTPIKATIRVRNMSNFKDHVLMTAELATVGSMTGFPQDLLSRSLEFGPVDLTQFMEQAAKRLGINNEEMLQRMFDNKGKMAFIKAMNDVGHTNFDKIRSAIAYSGESYGDGREYSLDEMFKMVSKRERKLVQLPRDERVHAGLHKPIVFGQSSGVLGIDYWTEARVWYDPKSKSMKGELTPGEGDAIYANIYSDITPNTSHQDLLGVRRSGQDLARQLGFPEPNKASYW
ncbi:MAG: hypothetical protein Q8P26_03560 [Candidatus Levybacteria bacterium]|nr:hypothetical protein [Candidatus Levybacteria bacterium]